MLKYTHTLYIWIKRINFGQKLAFKNMACFVSLPDWLYRFLHTSPLNVSAAPIQSGCYQAWKKYISFTFVHFMLVKWLGHNVVVAFLTKYTTMNHKFQVICFAYVFWCYTFFWNDCRDHNNKSCWHLKFMLLFCMSVQTNLTEKIIQTKLTLTW